MTGSDYGGGLPPNDRVHGHPSQPPSASEAGYQLDRERSNMTPSPSLQNGPPVRHPGSPAPSNHGDTRPSGERNRSRGRGRTASGQVRVCQKCGEQLTGQFVRALDGTFHLDCFKCRVGSPPSSLPSSPLRDLCPARATITNILLACRIVDRLLPPSSSLLTMKKGVANIPCARPTTFAD